MQRPPTKAELDYLAAAGVASDRAADELALTLAELEAHPREAAAELVKLRRLRIACEARQRRLPDNVKTALAGARAPSIREFLDNQPELQP